MLLQEHQWDWKLTPRHWPSSFTQGIIQHSIVLRMGPGRSEGMRGGGSPVNIFLPLPLLPYCTSFWFSCRIGLSLYWTPIAQDRGQVPGERCSHTTHKPALLKASSVNMATKICGTCFNTSIGMLFVLLQCQPISPSTDTLNYSAQQEPSRLETRVMKCRGVPTKQNMTR